MLRANRDSVITRALACWNWKCALLSATVRSAVYVAALARSGPRGSLSIVLVEMAYVTVTAGIYAGMQQRALSLRARWLGNIVIVMGVPSLAQALDWLAHRAAGPVVPEKAIFSVCVFTFLSALFHLHVMRRGTFLTGHRGRSLFDDFRRMPRLIAVFVLSPFTFLSSRAARLAAVLVADAEAVP
jgi:hypothetical protein